MHKSLLFLPNVDMADDIKQDLETTPDAPVQEAPVEPVTPDAAQNAGKWYVVHAQSGFEAKAKEGLEQRVKTLGISDRIFEIVIPMREVMTIKKSQKKMIKEKVFPGYLLIRMILDDNSWLVVRTTQGITGFVGAGTKPTPITEKEVEAIRRFVEQKEPTFKTKFSVGMPVKITDGPLSDSFATIESIDDSKGKVRVLVDIFQRETVVELDFLQIAKL